MLRLVSASDLPDQSGRTAVVTGANSGIGYAAANALAAKGARVLLAVRDLDKGRAAAGRIGVGAQARHLDLASLDSVRAFAAGIGEPIDYLINNAGAMSSTRQVTADGFESQFGVNHLGHFALTNLLIERVTHRVVSISSSAHKTARIDFDDLQWERRPYKPFGAYGQSKLAILLFTAELQRLLTAACSPVRSAAADPGWASTGFTIDSGRRAVDLFAAIATPVIAQGPEGGALPTLLATLDDVPGNAYAGPSRLGGIRGPATLVNRSTSAQDTTLARRLWTTSEELTHTAFPLATSTAS